MSIWNELVKRVINGESFYINFETRTMKIGKQKIIDNGEYNASQKLIDIDEDDLISNIELLYALYKYSTPSERNDKKRRCYFKALSADEMTDEQLVNGGHRDSAQAALEGYILCRIIDGSFVWDEEKFGKWFWVSKNDSDLVILKKWIEKEN